MSHLSMNHLKSFTMKKRFHKPWQVGLIGPLAFLLFPGSLRADRAVNLPNAGLELWQDSVPLYWSGSTSNIPPEGVFPSSDAHSGLWACQLVRTQKQHVRWSSSPLALPSGSYRLEYYVKGQGCLRNSYYSGTAYAAYAPYDTLSTDDWLKKSYVFELKRDLDSLQLIFSLCQTDKQGLLIDDVALMRVLPDSFTPFHYDEYQVQALAGGFRLYLASPARVQVYDLSGHCLIDERVEGIKSFSLPRGFYLLHLPASHRTLKLSVR